MPRWVLLVIATSLVLLAGVASGQEPSEWRMLGGGPGHAGQVSGPLPPYREVWRKAVPAGGAQGGAIVAAES
ncbi:MAG: hypothetical protein ACRDHK_11755, partial [Actinomycetota bacterium]